MTASTIGEAAAASGDGLGGGGVGGSGVEGAGAAGAGTAVGVGGDGAVDPDEDDAAVACVCAFDPASQLLLFRRQKWWWCFGVFEEEGEYIKVYGYPSY
jgi:hypothetical protein